MSTTYNFTYTLTSEETQNEAYNNVTAASAKIEYAPTSHFFVDESKLSSPITANYVTDAFGPVSTSLTTKYRATSKVRAASTDPVKVFAVCGGQVLIQPQTDDATKVNLILKPSASYAPLKIKYFIYRGINKADLIGNNILKPIANNDPNQPIFLNKLWNQYIAFNTSLKDPSTGENFPPPTEFPSALIGYDENQSDATLIENYFTKKEINISYQIPSCNAGEHLGNFTGEIGLDIVLDHGDYQLQNQEELFKFDLKFARKKEHVFDTATIPSSTPIKIKRYQEYIHQFMDAAAFWGSHIQCGSIKTINNATSIKTNNDIFTKILNKYQTQNKIYVYIQAENNRSYNYYDTTRKVFGFNPTGQLNNTSGWPIIIAELTVTDNTPTRELVTFNLEYNIDIRIPVHQRHIALNVISPNNNISQFPLLERPNKPATIPDFIIDKTADISTVFQVNGTKSCANFLMIYGNLKQRFPLKKYYNDLFPVNFNTNFLLPTIETEEMSSWATYDKSRMVNLDYVLEIGASIQNKLVFDNGKGPAVLGIPQRKARRLYMAILKSNSNHQSTQYDNLNIDTVTSGICKYTPKPKPEPEFGSEPEQYVQNIYNSTDFLVCKRKFVGGVDINSLSLVHKITFSKKNSYFHLGITEEEYNKLVYGQINIPAAVPPTPISQFLPNDADNVFFHLEEDLSFYNPNAQKFKVGLRFEDATGNISILFPEIANEVFVYTTDNFYFFSEEYSAYQEYATTDYVRNYEEKIGLEIKDFNKTYEDWFIEKDSGMKNKVDTFISALTKIKNTSTFYNSAKTLVENSALGIWNQAVITVQANATTTPDDRPLYWARIKMQVALKSHPYFNGGENAGDLEDLILLFEEKSRNYNGINFSNANGKKKILITGFDPFQLESNKNQSNPSGVSASYLHGKTIGNSYIQTMIFPVRYRDFDGKANNFSGKGNGVVEQYIAPLIGSSSNADNKADMVITISQSGLGNYNIDRFATINRGGDSDNLNAIREKNSDSVILDSSEQDLIWIETTLPKAMAMDGGATQAPDEWKHFTVYAQHYKLLDDSSTIKEDPTYLFKWDPGIDNYVALYPNKIFTTSKKDHNLLDNGTKKRIIEGSGSNYLSNEIFYRVALSRERWKKANSGKNFPTGHFHIAYIQQAPRDLTDKYFGSNRTVYDESIKQLKTVESRIALIPSDLKIENNLF
jgi:hypothetical protein